MEFKLNLILALCIIFCLQYEFWSANAIVGQNLQYVIGNELRFVAAFIHNIPGRYNIHTNFFCAGTIITRSHVLSTAHCTTDWNIVETLILAGAHNITNARSYSILWWINFAEWNHYSNRRTLIGINDISMTKIRGNFHESIPAAIISPIRSEQLPDRNAQMVGWGKTNNGDISLHLLVGIVKILSNIQCQREISILEAKKVMVDARYLCTNAIPYLLLQEGDFGGPLVIGDYVVGINKETRPHRAAHYHPGNVNIHMSVDFYRGFITDTSSDEFNWQTPI